MQISVGPSVTVTNCYKDVIYQIYLVVARGEWDLAVRSLGLADLPDSSPTAMAQLTSW